MPDPQCSPVTRQKRRGARERSLHSEHKKLRILEYSNSFTSAHLLNNLSTGPEATEERIEMLILVWPQGAGDRGKSHHIRHPRRLRRWWRSLLEFRHRHTRSKHTKAFALRVMRGGTKSRRLATELPIHRRQPRKHLLGGRVQVTTPKVSPRSTRGFRSGAKPRVALSHTPDAGKQGQALFPSRHELR